MTNTFKVGDKVTFAENPMLKASLVGRVFTVDAVPEGRRQTYYISGHGARYRARPNELVKADEKAPSVIGVPFDDSPWVDTNAIVTLKSPWSDITTTTPLVVHKGGAGRDKLRLFRLGDTSGKYVRITASAVEVRDLDWLAEQLLERATA